MKLYKPVGLTSIGEDLPTTVIENFNAIASSISSTQTSISSLENSTRKLEIDTQFNATTILNRTSLSFLMAYTASVPATSGLINYNSGTKVLSISRTSLTGMELPDLVKHPPMRYELSSGTSYAVSTGLVTIVQFNTYYTITFITDSVFSSFTALDGVNVILHWN